MTGNPENIRKIFGSSIAIIAGYGLAGILNMSTKVVLGRFLGPSQYGVLSQGFAILDLIVIITMLGMYNTIPRFLSYEDDSSAIYSALVLALPLSIITGIILFVFAGKIAGFIGAANLTGVLKALAVSAPATTALAIFLAGFRGRNRTLEFVALDRLYQPGLLLLISAPLVILYPEAVFGALGNTAAYWIAGLTAGVLYIKSYSLTRPDISELKKMVSFSSPLYIGDMVNSGVTWGNILLLGYLIDSASSGLYNAAFPVASANNIVLLGVIYLSLPIFSRLYREKNFQEMKSIYTTICRWLWMATTPIMLVLAIKSRFLLNLLFSSSYSSAAILLTILALATYLDVLFGPLAQLLISFGETREELYSRAIGLVTLGSAGFLTIPEIGLKGAGIGYLLAILTTNTARLFYARVYTDFNPVDPEAWKIIPAAILSIPLLVLLNGDLVTEIASILVFGTVYAASLAALKPLKDEDIYCLEKSLEKYDVKEKYVEKLEKFTRKLR